MPISATFNQINSVGGTYLPSPESIFSPTTARIPRTPTKRKTVNSSWRWTEERRTMYLDIITGGGVSPLGIYLEKKRKTWKSIATKMLKAFPYTGPKKTKAIQIDEMIQRCRNYWSDKKKQKTKKDIETWSIMLKNASGTRSTLWKDIHSDGFIVSKPPKSGVSKKKKQTKPKRNVIVSTPKFSWC